MKGWVFILGSIVVIAPLASMSLGFPVGFGAEDPEIVRVATPATIGFEVLDENEQVIYSTEDRGIRAEVAPGSEDGFSQLLSPFLLGLREGESMRTVEFDHPFGEPRTYVINRTLWTGPPVQKINASPVEHVPEGEEFVVEPINLTAELLEKNRTHAKVEYRIPNSTILHPSNLNLSVMETNGTVRVGLDHVEGEILSLRDSCRDLIGIPAGWYKIDDANRTHLTATYYPVQDAGSFEVARKLSTDAAFINFTVEEVHTEEGAENRANLTDEQWFTELPRYLQGTDQITYDREVQDVSSNPLVREI